MLAKSRGTATTSKRPPSKGTRNGTGPRAVAVLGATGTVGQRFIQLLESHPWFFVAEVMASDQSAGKTYAEAVGERWKLSTRIPERVAGLKVRGPGERLRSPILFSALDASVAGDLEERYARQGHLVSSNSGSHRLDPLVPLVIPEVNRDHIELLDKQRYNGGGILTNPNCAAIVLVMALAPLHRAFGVESVIVTTFQATSGAGYPGVPSLDILGNVIPFIAGEEGKIETEIQKMLGRRMETHIEHAPIKISAHANRVSVENGHTVCLSVDFEKHVDAGAALEVLRDWQGDESARGLPSAPERALVVTDAPDRPQPRRDVDAGRGMTVTVGRVREDPLFDVKLVAMGHNTVRGAAGASVLNAELLVATGQAGLA